LRAAGTPGEDGGVRFRAATAGDAETIAALHADSWRRFYRGAYSDEFLDGDLLEDRRRLWHARLGGEATTTVLAEVDGEPAGFVHVVLDDDPEWGSLVDNLHVTDRLRGCGIGARLMTISARTVIDNAAAARLYLWVLEQNRPFRGFYAARGGKEVGSAEVGGGPGRLNGKPRKLRYAWDAATLAEMARPRT
jgi:GNAT superfamily N-acetyltransferase